MKFWCTLILIGNNFEWKRCANKHFSISLLSKEIKLLHFSSFAPWTWTGAVFYIFLFTQRFSTCLWSCCFHFHWETVRNRELNNWKIVSSFLLKWVWYVKWVLLDIFLTANFSGCSLLFWTFTKTLLTAKHPHHTTSYTSSQLMWMRVRKKKWKNHGTLCAFHIFRNIIFIIRGDEVQKNMKNTFQQYSHYILGKLSVE